MPTPGGLLKAGDRLVHSSDPEVIFKVVERHGNDKGYAVVLEREDGQVLPPSTHRRYGDPHQMLLLEAHYWVFMDSGYKGNKWSLVRR